jgi:ATPase family AAA domain-containing protein 3A/B
MIPIPTDIDWDKYFMGIASQVKGFSGREIAKLAISWQASAYGSLEGKLTLEMIDKCVDEMKEQHQQKVKWQDDDDGVEIVD